MVNLDQAANFYSPLLRKSCRFSTHCKHVGNFGLDGLNDKGYVSLAEGTRSQDSASSLLGPAAASHELKELEQVSLPCGELAHVSGGVVEHIHTRFLAVKQSLQEVILLIV